MFICVFKLLEIPKERVPGIRMKNFPFEIKMFVFHSY